MSPVPRPNRRAVLVEDKPAVQHELMNDLLALVFDEVLGCDDVAPALHLLQREPWDLAIVDLALRTSYGLFLLDALSTRTEKQKVVVFTVSGTVEARQTCGLLGSDAFFHRPSQTRELLDYCRGVLG